MTFTKRKISFIIIAIILAGFALASSLNLFSPDLGYYVVPHGNHNHYVPNDRNPDIPVHSFPQRPPRQGEIITPDGQIIRDTTVVAPNR